MMKALGSVVSSKLAVRNLENLLKILGIGFLHDEDAFVTGRHHVRRGIISGLSPKILQVVPDRRILHQ
jgi:hypothetical protein